VALPSWAGVGVDAQTITVIENEVRLVVPNTDMALSLRRGREADP
jgi:hypothetical protein